MVWQLIRVMKARDMCIYYFISKRSFAFAFAFAIALLQVVGVAVDMIGLVSDWPGDNPYMSVDLQSLAQSVCSCGVYRGVYRTSRQRCL